jgi:GTP pyrophosphokinase
VLTPKGKVLDLPSGSTVLDFAYHVHTEIGNRCRGAKVNGRIVPLTHILKSGDQVEIVTAKTGGPSRDWLNPQFGYLKTVRARAKAHQWFKRQDRDQNILDGREVLERELKRLGIENLSFEHIAHQLKFQRNEDMLAAIGGGDVRLTQVLGAIQALVQPSLEKIQPSVPKKAKIQESKGAEIIVAGVGNLFCQMARCCKPIPGDSIIGYISPGRGVTVHRKDCINILNVKEHKMARLVPVEWGGETQNQYAVDIEIHGIDRQGLLRDISAIFAMEHMNVVGIESAVNKNDNTVYFKFKLEILGIEQLGKVLTRIQQLPNVLDARRVQS